jgi:hypothetical protein
MAGPEAGLGLARFSHCVTGSRDGLPMSVSVRSCRLPRPALRWSGLRGADEGGDVFGGLAGELGQDAGVGVGGDGDGRQAESLLDDQVCLVQRFRRRDGLVSRPVERGGHKVKNLARG